MYDFIPIRKLLPPAGIIGTSGANKDIYARSRARRHFVYRRTDTTISVYTDTDTTGLRYAQNSGTSRLRSSVRKEDIKVISDWQLLTKSRDNIALSSSDTTRLCSRILSLVAFAATSFLINLIF